MGPQTFNSKVFFSVNDSTEGDDYCLLPSAGKLRQLSSDRPSDRLVMHFWGTKVFAPQLTVCLIIKKSASLRRSVGRSDRPLIAILILFFSHRRQISPRVSCLPLLAPLAAFWSLMDSHADKVWLLQSIRGRHKRKTDRPTGWMMSGQDSTVYRIGYRECCCCWARLEWVSERMRGSQIDALLTLIH